MKEFSFSAPFNFKVYYQGYQLAEKPKKRKVSLILAIIAGVLLYYGWYAEPMDENMTYAGILTIVYILIGRDLMMKMKVRSLWAKNNLVDTTKTYHISGSAVSISSQEGETQNFAWSDFTDWRQNDQVCILIEKNATENWVSLPLSNLSDEDKNEVFKYLHKLPQRQSKN